MKKIITIAFLIFCSWQNKPAKVFKVETDLATWNRVINVIDLSTAEPRERIMIRDFIISQLNDSTINKK